MEITPLRVNCELLGRGSMQRQPKSEERERVAALNHAFVQYFIKKNSIHAPSTPCPSTVHTHSQSNLP